MSIILLLFIIIPIISIIIIYYYFNYFNYNVFSIIMYLFCNKDKIYLIKYFVVRFSIIIEIK